MTKSKNLGITDLFTYMDLLDIYFLMNINKIKYICIYINISTDLKARVQPVQTSQTVGTTYFFCGTRWAGLFYESARLE